MNIDKINDDTYLSVTEALGLAGDAMASGDTDLLLVVNLAEGRESAVLGGHVTGEKIERIERLLGELKACAALEGGGAHTLHVWQG